MDSLPTQQQASRLGTLFLFSNLFVIILTIIPVIANLPDLKGPYTGWYTGNDILRLLEPIIALPFQLFILLASPLYQNQIHSKQASLVLVCFAIAAGLYQQGAGFHSAANMFKHSAETVKDTLAIQVAQDSYDWMRDVWEHLISHYMYAVGGILISWINAYIFRDYVLDKGLETLSSKLIWLAASILYSIVIAAVGVQFIKGIYVAFGLIVIYGFGVLYYLVDQNLSTIQRKRVKNIYSIVLEFDGTGNIGFDTSLFTLVIGQVSLVHHNTTERRQFLLCLFILVSMFDTRIA